MTTKIVNLVSHPLVQHKLSLTREKGRSTTGFRELLNEIGMLLCYEVTRDLPLVMVDIDTPVAAMKALKIAGKIRTLAPILRAGAGWPKQNRRPSRHRGLTSAKYERGCRYLPAAP